MRIILILLVVLFSASLNINAVASPPPALDQYLKALERTTHGQTSQSDIDAVLEYYADNVTYEHPSIGIVITGRAALAAGMRTFLDTYGGEASDSRIEIIDYIKSKNMVAFDLRISFLQNSDSGVTPVSRRQTRIVEFRDGKITRVIDDW